jgi:hypothetical protein
MSQDSTAMFLSKGDRGQSEKLHRRQKATGDRFMKQNLPVFVVIQSGQEFHPGVSEMGE